jgi:hypothetical protein
MTHLVESTHVNHSSSRLVEPQTTGGSLMDNLRDAISSLKCNLPPIWYSNLTAESILLAINEAVGGVELLIRGLPQPVRY